MLRDGRMPAVLKSNLSEPRIIEVMGLSGVDAVWLCNEHVPNDWSMLENQIRAARLYDIDSIVRVARGSYSDYIRPLEAGATGIMVPHVMDAKDARQVVDWVRFHPVGKRALDGGNVDGLFGLLPSEDYIHHTNTERILILQIESPEALENVDEIAAVPGFDILLFGPGDFSHRIGKIGHFDAPEVVAARKKVAAAARKHGKFAMSVLTTPFDELMAEGYQIFNIGTDLGGLSSSFQANLARFHNLKTQKLPVAKKRPAVRKSA